MGICVDGRLNRGNKAWFSDFSGLKSVFETLRFRDGLVWTVDLTVEIKLFSNFSGEACKGPKTSIPYLFAKRVRLSLDRFIYVLLAVQQRLTNLTRTKR